MNAGDQNGKRYSTDECDLFGKNGIAYDFLKNRNITIIKLIVNLIMCGFAGKQKRIFNLSFCLGPILLTIFNYRKRQSDTWWLLSMRLRTRLGHGQYLFLCKAHRRSIEIQAQIVGC